MFQQFNFTVLLSIFKCWQLYLVVGIYIDKGIRRIISSRGIRIPQLSSWGAFFSPHTCTKITQPKFQKRSLALFRGCLPIYFFFPFLFSLLFSKCQLECRAVGLPRGSLLRTHQTCVVALSKLISIVSLSKQHLLNMNFV